MSVSCLMIPATLDVCRVRQLRGELGKTLDDPATHVVVLAGRGPDFCCGLDLESILNSAAADPGEVAAAVGAFAECLQLLDRSVKPTLAVVDGRAVGGGVGLAAACDVVLATDRASFGLPELLLGLVPAIILPFLLRRVPTQKARLWALTGMTHDAATARALGLVDELVASSATAAAVERWARLLGRVGPAAAGQFKRLLTEDQDAALESAVRLTREILADEAVLGPIRTFSQEGLPPWEEGGER